MIASNLNAEGVRVWVATQPVDMRKGFDGLAEVVRAFLGHDPLSGSLFVFRNRSAQRAKVLWYDRDGLALYYKRLDRGVFRFPNGDEKALAIDSAQLLRLLSGMTVVATRNARNRGQNAGISGENRAEYGSNVAMIYYHEIRLRPPRRPGPAQANARRTRRRHRRP